MKSHPPPRLPPQIRVLERGWLSSNNILCIEGEGATLVDTGYAAHADLTLALVQQSLGQRPLTRLLNTHSHSDHIGGNARLQETYGCTIVIPAGIEEAVKHWDENALLLTPSGQWSERFRHDGVLSGGDRFEMGGLEWHALDAPGHDMNAQIFHCPQARLLISGDALWRDGFGIVFGEMFGNTGGLQATRNTLDLIADLGVETVIPGHGAPFADVGEALQRAYQRLAAFETHPERMARNALKGCFTFNLLELRRLPRSALPDYLRSIPFFKDVAVRMLGMDPEQAAQWLLADLLKAGAVVLEADFIVPRMAA